MKLSVKKKTGVEVRGDVGEAVKQVPVNYFPRTPRNTTQPSGETLVPVVQVTPDING